MKKQSKKSQLLEGWYIMTKYGHSKGLTADLTIIKR